MDTPLPGPPQVLTLLTRPRAGAESVDPTQYVSVTFSEPVTLTGSWFSISCTNTGAHTAAVSGGPTTFTLNPDVDFGGLEVCAELTAGSSRRPSRRSAILRAVLVPDDGRAAARTSSPARSKLIIAPTQLPWAAACKTCWLGSVTLPAA